jgi:hypothetical protein
MGTTEIKGEYEICWKCSRALAVSDFHKSHQALRQTLFSYTINPVAVSMNVGIQDFHVPVSTVYPDRPSVDVYCH